MENKEEAAIETNVPTIAPEEDLEGKVAVLEAEKAKLSEERENYKLAYLKEKAKKSDGESDEDDRMRRIAQETLAESRLAEIAREQDAIIKKALKENKELKLAHLNKPAVPSSMGAHSDSVSVKDTLITPDQMAYFKAKNFTDKDIERYKRNLMKNTR